MNTDMAFCGNEISFRGQTWIVEFPVRDVRLVGDKIIVLYDPGAGLGHCGQFRNLIALNLKSERVWVAQHPTNQSNDCYYKIVTTEPLTVYSTASFACEIDLATGRLKRTEFFK
jgi:hypothetical protein